MPEPAAVSVSLDWHVHVNADHSGQHHVLPPLHQRAAHPQLRRLLHRLLHAPVQLDRLQLHARHQHFHQRPGQLSTRQQLPAAAGARPQLIHQLQTGKMKQRLVYLFDFIYFVRFRTIILICLSARPSVCNIYIYTHTQIYISFILKIKKINKFLVKL